MSYAPRGIFITYSEPELLKLRETCTKLLLEGKTVMGYSGEGTSAERQFTMPIDDLLQEITWALQSKFPTKYGYIAQRVRNYVY